MSKYQEALEAVARGAQKRSQLSYAVNTAKKSRKALIRPPETGSGGLLPQQVPPQPTPVPPVGGLPPITLPDGTTINPGGANAGPPQMEQLPDGTVVQWNGTEWERAPDIFQPPSVSIPETGPQGGTTIGGTVPFPQRAVPAQGSEAFNSALGGGLNPLPAYTALSPYLSDSVARRLAGLDDGSGGGGGNALGWAQFEYQKQQDELSNFLNVITLMKQQQQEAEARRQAQQALQLQVAPFLAPGRTHFGGLEPNGPYAAVANFAGVPYQPQALNTIPFSTAGPPVDPEIAALTAQYRSMLGV